jgi:hypothetical protein
MMKYCELHKDLGDEEGDGCPLCECMNNKAKTINRLGIERYALWGLLQEATEIVRAKVKSNPWPAEKGGFANGCQFCGKPYPQPFSNADDHYENCFWLKATTLLSKLETVLGKKS